MAERDAALKQANTHAQELSQLRESSSALQQQLHVLTLAKQAEIEKAVKVNTKAEANKALAGVQPTCLSCTWFSCSTYNVQNFRCVHVQPVAIHGAVLGCPHEHHFHGYMPAAATFLSAAKALMNALMLMHLTRRGPQ